MIRVGVFVLSIIMMLVGVVDQPRTAAAQSGERCFAETGFCIAGPIRTYWERNGGLPVFGYPISAQREELAEGRSIQVQWFERDRLEIQADGTLTAGRLGARYLELAGRPWFFNEDGRALRGCLFVPQTGYNVCGSFRDYWERNGGVERFGYPITNEIEERLNGRVYRVQYFERRRLEDHPQLAGTPYEVQLGLLGNAIATASVCPAAPTSNLQRAVRNYLAMMNCPLDQWRTGSIAWQVFDKGIMYWATGTASTPPMIFALINDDRAQQTRWLAYTDTYREGEPVGKPTPAVPPGRIAPQRGFGKIWWNEPTLQQALGWPLDVEQTGNGVALPFMTGGWMIERNQPSLIVVMQPDGTAFGVRPEILLP
jgi:hypothetical protein